MWGVASPQETDFDTEAQGEIVSNKAPAFEENLPKDAIS